MTSPPPLRIGYVPEHFSTPLHFAFTHHALSYTLTPFPSGTGHMITSLRSHEIDIGIGLTEGWIAGLGKAQGAKEDAGYKLVGTYVDTPLCWAISTGAERVDLRDARELKGRRVGVSRVGSGSHIMSFVLADVHKWLLPSSTLSATEPAPFEIVPLQTFEKLREGVNDGTADFFMWEYFTSKRYYDNGSIKKIGEILTPWPSWHIVARTDLIGGAVLEEFFRKLDMGVDYFEGHLDEAVEYISSELDYEKGDAREWLKTVRFARGVRGVGEKVVRETVEVLEKAGVIGGVDVGEMVGVEREG